jgi:hypothetical protein
VAAAAGCGTTIFEAASAFRTRARRLDSSHARAGSSAFTHCCTVSLMYLLDTNVVSELRKPKPHGAVLAWFEATADEQLHLSAVTIGEIQAGH